MTLQEFEARYRLGEVDGRMFEVRTRFPWATVALKTAATASAHLFYVGDIWRGQDFKSFCGVLKPDDCDRGWSTGAEFCERCWTAMTESLL